MRTMPELVFERLAARGDAVAIDDGRERISHRQLAESARAAAAAFVAAGARRGDRVAIWAPNIHEWISAALGAQLIGCVLTPLNTRYKGREAADIIDRSGARWLLTVTDFLDIDYLAMLREHALSGLEARVLLRGSSDEKGVVSWADFLAAGAGVSDGALRARMDEVRGADALDLLFTSGTTGRSKGVLTTHEQNLRVYDTWTRSVGLRPDDRYLIINPFFHAFGYKAGWLAALMVGCPIMPLAHFDVDLTLKRIADWGVSMLPGPPTIFQSLLAHPELAQADISSLRLAVTGAASVPVRLIERMREELGFESVVTAYGLTESCGTVSICPEGSPPEIVATTAGRAIDGVEIRCVDADGVELPAGEAGELLVRGYNVMLGYDADAEATAAAIDADGWLHTGDVAIIDDRGFVRITDRVKDMFIVGGFNCYPAEIENSLCAIDGISQAAVVGVADERLGEVACAFVVLERGAALDEEAVVAWCRDNMANYKVPRRVRFVDALPMNAAGKVLKPQLRATAAES